MVIPLGKIGDSSTRRRCQPIPGRYFCHPWQKTSSTSCPLHPRYHGDVTYLP